jgi:hypothetical protein
VAQKFNIVCVRVGPAYSTEYVDKLYDMVRANCTKDFDFWCITDMPHDNPNVKFVKVQPLPVPVRWMWWYKMYMFKYDIGLSGPCFYIDLDVIINGNIDKFLNSYDGNFWICQDFNRKVRPDYPVSNSSVMLFEHEQYRKFWDEFAVNMRNIMSSFRGDQDYITARLDKDKRWWPWHWTISYRWEYLEGKAHPDNSIVVFHGKPKPHELDWELEDVKVGA